MADPRYEFLGIEDPGHSMIANQFYSGVPDTSYMQQGYAPDSYDYRHPFEVAQDQYEDEIIAGAKGINPDDDDYDAQVLDYFASQRDPDAASYPRVQAALRALSSNRQSRLQRKDRSEKFGIAMAEAGVDPDTFSSFMDEDGQINPYKAAYAIAERKRNPDMAKLQQLSEKTALEVGSLFEDAQRNYTPDEKQAIFRQAKGREISTGSAQDWDEADALLRSPARTKLRAAVDSLERSGYDMRRWKQVAPTSGSPQTSSGQAPVSELDAIKAEARKRTQGGETTSEATSSAAPSSTVVDSSGKVVAPGVRPSAAQARPATRLQSAVNQAVDFGNGIVDDLIMGPKTLYRAGKAVASYPFQRTWDWLNEPVSQ